MAPKCSRRPAAGGNRQPVRRTPPVLAATCATIRSITVWASSSVSVRAGSRSSSANASDRVPAASGGPSKTSNRSLRASSGAPPSRIAAATPPAGTSAGNDEGEVATNGRQPRHVGKLHHVRRMPRTPDGGRARRPPLGHRSPASAAMRGWISPNTPACLPATVTVAARPGWNGGPGCSPCSNAATPRSASTASSTPFASRPSNGRSVSFQPSLAGPHNGEAELRVLAERIAQSETSSRPRRWRPGEPREPGWWRPRGATQG